MKGNRIAIFFFFSFHFIYFYFYLFIFDTQACRSLGKAKEVEAEIKESLKPNAKNQVISLELDLGSLSSVKKFAEQIKQMKLPLKILVNNAGVMATAYAETQEGLELQFGTVREEGDVERKEGIMPPTNKQTKKQKKNYVGHYLLTRLLLDLLKENKPSKIINISSDAHDSSKQSLFKESAELVQNKKKERKITIAFPFFAFLQQSRIRL